MKNSNIYLFAMLLLVFSACSNQNKSAYYDDYAYYADEEQAYYEDEYYEDNGQGNIPAEYVNQNMNSNNATPNNQPKNTSSNRNVKTVMHTVPSSQFSSPFAQIPLPANWKINTNQKVGEPSVSGPNGIKVYDYKGQFFMYSSDPYMQQSYQMAGQPMKRPVGAASVLKNDLMAQFNKLGQTFVKQYPLPQLAQVNKSYDSKLWKALPTQSKFEVLGSEWTDGKGNKSIVILNYSENTSQGSTYWGYYLSVLEAPINVFEKAKEAYIYGLANIQHNPQNIQAYNRSEQQKSNASWAAHNQKMANKQASFNASQKRLNDTYSEISDINMQGYKNRTAIQDQGYSNYINSVREVENVYNPTNGQSYEVQSGYNQYWMNNNGEYIQSNDYNYNPNTDPNANQYNWEQGTTYP